MRLYRRAALGATVVALVVSACTSGGSSPSASVVTSAVPTVGPSTAAASPSTAPSPASAAPTGTIASQLTLGGPPECPQRPFCAVGLKKTYGLDFKLFLPLDAGGPLSLSAVKSGLVDVGLLFSSDPSIQANDLVVLEDDKHLQLADNLIPVVRNDLLAKAPGLADLINPFTAKLTQDALNDLNKQVTVDGKDSKSVAAAWLTANGLTPGGTSGNGIKVKVGSTNFYEQEILGEIFAQVLEANGFSVERKFQLGNREVVFPALEKGDIDILAEYAATALEFVNKSAGEATSDPTATAAKLNERLAPLKLTALAVAPATDQNAFVVSKATADKYKLTKLSDLANPAP
jgi:glycine betaine/choline ABC-type transport system substrate-binding protein